MNLEQSEILGFSVPFVCESSSSTDPGFSALPPIASPAQMLRLNRDQIIKTYVAEAIDQARQEQLIPAAAAISNLGRFLQLLPSDFPVTDPYVSESGSLCFDWDEDPNCQFSILLKESNRISYAAYFSGEKVNGSADFSRVEFPQDLLEAAKRWVDCNGRRA